MNGEKLEKEEIYKKKNGILFTIKKVRK